MLSPSVQFNQQQQQQQRAATEGVNPHRPIDEVPMVDDHTQPQEGGNQPVLILYRGIVYDTVRVRHRLIIQVPLQGGGGIGATGRAIQLHRVTILKDLPSTIANVWTILWNICSDSDSRFGNKGSNLLTYHFHPTRALYRVEAGCLRRDLATIDTGGFEC
uniref:Uncharacterized protein n=1 Tax=Anopheles culicifacies TaxID=139723 RepID=A0A182M5W4_9DIPT